MLRLLSLILLLATSLPALAQFGAQAVSAGRWEPRNYATSLGLQASYCTYWANTVTLNGAAASEWIDRSFVTGRPENLLVQSEEFDATWSPVRLSVDDQAANNPYGVGTADKLIEDGTASATHYVEQTGIECSPGAYNLSCWVKKDTRDEVRLDALIGSDSVICYFDVDAGTAGSPTLGGSATSPTASISAPIDGWYLCSVGATFPTAGIGTVRVRLAVSANSTYNGDGTSGLFLWGASLRSTASSPSSAYVATTTLGQTASRSLAQGTAASQPVVSRADNKANLLVQSQTLNTTWSLNRLKDWGSGSVANTVTVTDPVGGNTAEFIQEDLTTGNHGIILNPVACAPHQNLRFSCWIRGGGRTWVLLLISDTGANWVGANYQLAGAGAVGTLKNTGTGSGASGTVSEADGWYLCTLSGVPSTSGTASLVSIYTGEADDDINVVGDGSSGLYLWGASLQPSATIPVTAPNEAGGYIATTTEPAYPGLAVGGTYKPVLVFDGSNDSMSVACAAMVQPTVVIWGGRQVTFTSGDSIFDSPIVNRTMQLYQRTAAGNLSITTDATVSTVYYVGGMPVGNWGVVQSVFNGANSSLTVNKAIVTGNAGAGNGSGISLGGLTAKGNIETFGLIVMTNTSAAATNYARLGFLGMANTK